MYDSILLAIDLNDEAGRDRVAQVAVRIARDQQAKLHVVNVIPDFGMSIVGSYFPADHAAKILEDEQRKLDEWATATLPGDVDSMVSVRKGKVYHVVLKTAEEVEADLIVIGSHRPELEDYLLGPNSARVVRHAKQSVFVVRG